MTQYSDQVEKRRQESLEERMAILNPYGKTTRGNLLVFMAMLVKKI